MICDIQNDERFQLPESMTALSIWEEKLKSTFSYLTFFPGNLTSPPKPTSFCTAKTPHLSDCRILWETTKSQRAVTGARCLVAFLLRSVNRSIWTRPRSWVPSSWRLPAPAVKTQGDTYHVLNISAQFCDSWFIHGGGCVMRVFMLRIFVSNMSVIHIQRQTNAFL